MDLHLLGQVAIVTGGAKGVGRGISEVLAEEGVRVAMCYRSDRDGSEASAAQVSQATGSEVRAFRCDVSSSEQVEALFDAVEREMGPVDILVNNAMSTRNMPFEDQTDEDWDYTIHNALNSAFYTCRRFVRDCRASHRGGHIVNVLSKAAFTSNTPGKSVYIAAKAGLVGLTRAIAQEGIGDGIYCNGIVPGYVLNQNDFHKGNQAYEQRLKYLPLGEFATPRDMGNTVAFLCSDRSRQTIGAAVDCTGGTML